MPDCRLSQRLFPLFVPDCFHRWRGGRGAVSHGAQRSLPVFLARSRRGARPAGGPDLPTEPRHHGPRRELGLRSGRQAHRLPPIERLQRRTSSAAWHAFYRQFGFEVVDADLEVIPGCGPTLTTMRRGRASRGAAG
jgi:hypothetical protein